MMKLIKFVGQPLCAVLYAVSTYFACKKKPVSLITLFATHLSEYFIIGRKTGKECGVSPVAALVNCLFFGFTWWLPLKNSKK